MSPDMVMCRGCGNFVTAVENDGSVTPLSEECPKCEGVKFEDIHTERFAPAIRSQ